MDHFCKRLLALSLFLSGSVLPAWPGESRSGPGVQDYDQIVSPDMESASSLCNRARVSLRNGNFTRAIALCKVALRKDDEDIDIHAAYAESMEAKLEHQVEKDPELYKACVREWLTVYRNEVGEEKNDSWKGLCLVGTMWNDDARGGLAKKHLKKLTGYLPKVWETDNRYLSRVLKPAQVEVSGHVSAAAQR